MTLIENKLYSEDLHNIANLPLPWEMLKNKVVLISGATGLIGTFLVDSIIYRNINFNQNTRVIAMGRNVDKAKYRFNYCFDSNYFQFIEHDIRRPIPQLGNIDYIIHAASNTHPIMYATDPVGTIMTNVLGTYNLSNYAINNKTKRFLLLSSVEIYGENRGDIDLFHEKYCGYIDCNTLRAGYPESKRTCEALCQAFSNQFDIEIVIARLSRIYGPTMQMNDSKVIAQFIKNALNKEPVILKSNGTQYYSFNYVLDAVSGLLYILLIGENQEAYNIASEDSNIMLKDLAGIIADLANTKVDFQLPNNVELTGFSKVTRAVMDSSKLMSLGWRAKYNIKEGIKRTLSILKELYCVNID